MHKFMGRHQTKRLPLRRHWRSRGNLNSYSNSYIESFGLDILSFVVKREQVLPDLVTKLPGSDAQFVRNIAIEAVHLIGEISLIADFFEQGHQLFPWHISTDKG